MMFPARNLHLVWELSSQPRLMTPKGISSYIYTKLFFLYICIYLVGGLLFSIIYGIILPIDELIFSRWLKQIYIYIIIIIYIYNYNIYIYIILVKPMECHDFSSEKYGLILSSQESARLRQKHQQAVQAGAGGWVSNPISPSRVSTREKRTKNANWVNVTIGDLKKILPITLLRVIPTLAFQVIYSDPYFDILPNILSDIYSDILSGISSSMLSGIYFGVLSGIYSGILCGILSRIYFGGILCGIYSGSLSGIYSGIYSGIPFGR